MFAASEPDAELREALYALRDYVEDIEQNPEELALVEKRIDTLHAAAKATGEFGYGAQWSGQGAPLVRGMPAGELVVSLREEMEKALSQGSTG